MAGISSRVDEHLSKGIPMGEAISKAVTESSHHVDSFEAARSKGMAADAESRNGSFNDSIARSRSK